MGLKTIIKMQKKKVIFALLSILLIANFAHAGLDNIRFKRLALDQGLSQEAVISIYQDNSGYMWFGTQEGLNRYDGYHFKVYSHNDRVPNSLSNDWVLSITEDKHGQLWVGTSGGGISVLDKNMQGFKHYKHDREDEHSLGNDNVQAMHKAKNGSLWIGTKDGLFRFDYESERFIAFDLNVGDTQDIVINSIIDGQDNDLLIGTSSNGLFSVNLSTNAVAPFSLGEGNKAKLTSNKISSLRFDNSNRLWIGYSDLGIDVVSFENQSIISFAHDQKDTDSLSSNLIKDVFQDKTNNIWVATDFGLNLYQESSNNFIRFNQEIENPYSLAGNKLTRIFQDRGGVFWVGSFSGLSKWNTSTSNFNHFRVKSDIEKSLSDNGVNAFSQDAENNIWIGTYGGLNRLNLETGNVKQYRHFADDSASLGSDRVMSLHADNDGKVWIGTRSNGLDMLEVSTGKFKHFLADQDNSNSIGANGVTSIVSAQNNMLWVATFGGGLNLLNPETEKFIHFKHDSEDKSSISSDRILSVLPTEDGLLWLGTWGEGISIFNPTTESAINIKHLDDQPDSLSNNVVLSIFEDSQNNIWVGTQGGGLNKLSAKNRAAENYTFERLSRHDGLPSNVVHGILEDTEGMIWISSNRGLTKYDPNLDSLINYDSSHGLQGNEFNSGAYFETKDGQFFFGGTNGVTAFYPELIKPNSHVPPVVLTNFLRLNESFSPLQAMTGSDAIQINYQDYLIAFEFAGLDFASPTNNQYNYKLEGFDDDWIEAGDLRRATYTNLPAGNYQFRVKASNNDGVWNEQGANLALTVLPAPWYSWWAYLGYTIVGLFIIAMLFRSYLNKLQKEAQYRAQLEEEVKNRTVELSQANELLLNASVTDQLTGLHNRRYLSNIIDSECAKVLRDVEKLNRREGISVDSGPRLFCLMFDLDGFKPINDTYGHDAGDQIICQISDLLKMVCRKSDTVIRWGGDEFLIVGRVEDMAEVDILAERLRSEIVSKGFDIGLKQKLHLSCSIGFGLYPFAPKFPDSFSWEQVQIIADRALYCSKDAGRNYWTGIIATDKQPSVSLMNTLVANLDQVISDGYVSIRESNINKDDKREQATGS